MKRKTKQKIKGGGNTCNKVQPIENDSDDYSYPSSHHSNHSSHHSNQSSHQTQAQAQPIIQHQNTNSRIHQATPRPEESPAFEKNEKPIEELLYENELGERYENYEMMRKYKDSLGEVYNIYDDPELMEILNHPDKVIKDLMKKYFKTDIKTDGGSLKPRVNKKKTVKGGGNTIRTMSNRIADDWDESIRRDQRLISRLRNRRLRAITPVNAEVEVRQPEIVHATPIQEVSSQNRRGRARIAPVEAIPEEIPIVAQRLHNNEFNVSFNDDIGQRLSKNNGGSMMKSQIKSSKLIKNVRYIK